MKKILRIIPAGVGIALLGAGLYIKLKSVVAFSVIGGGDGPTSVFITGTVSETLGTKLVVWGTVILGITALTVAVPIIKKRKK